MTMLLGPPSSGKSMLLLALAGKLDSNLKELVEVAQKKRKEKMQVQVEGSATNLDFENDELTEVLGADKRSRTRGISSNLSKKQLQRTSIAKVMLAIAKSLSNSEIKDEMTNMKSSIARVEGVLMDMLKHLTKNGMPNSQSLCGNTTPGTEVGSNSVHHPTQHNLMNMFESGNPPTQTLTPTTKVTLLGRDGVPVARGHVMTTTVEVCHGRNILKGEKKIYIEEVLVLDAPIYDGPQFGCSDLSDFVEGGALIWLESRLQYE